jgi:hypothetical protein
MEGLGRLFDVGIGVVPVDLNTGDGATGKRVSMVGAKGITFLALLGAAASGTDDVTLSVKQHTAYTSGTTGTATGATVRAWVKSETTLDNDESWVALTPSAGVVTLTGATYAAEQKLVAIEVDSRTLSDSYTHLSLDIGHTGNVVLIGGVLYILHSLFASRAPVNLGNLLNPGAADA